MIIKRFHVRDGFVLDEHPTGSVVRFDHHEKVVEELEAELSALQEVYDHAMNELYPTVAAERDALKTRVRELEADFGNAITECRKLEEKIEEYKKMHYESRSVRRRKAVQRGEPMPDFDSIPDDEGGL